MLRRHVLVIALAWLAALASCSSSDSTSETTALFSIPRAGITEGGFYALPFPNDIRRGDDGRIDLAEHPRPNELLGEYLDVMSARLNGFGISPVAFFRFNQDLDVATLPQSPADSIADGASAYIVDIDPDSPQRGQRIPVRFRFDRLDGSVIGSHWLGVQVVPGHPLAESRTYAAIISNRVHDTSGAAPQASSDFIAVMSETVNSSPEVERARQVYAPLRAWLAESTEVAVSAAVFTTQHVTDIVPRAREVIYREAAAPSARDVSRLSEDATLAVYEGMFSAPNFQTGTSPYQLQADGGEIVTDSNGDPEIQQIEDLRFAVSVPVGSPPVDGWPVVVFGHGTGGSYLSFRNNGTAARLAAEGIAAISMDQVLHGPRVPVGTSVELAFFNLLNPLAARDNNLQGAIDLLNLTRLAKLFDYTDPDGGRVIRFDAGKLMYFGHSQGGLTGTPFLAAEPDIAGAVLSGAGGLLYLSLLYKTEPVDIPALVSAIIRDDPIDEFNQVLALLQMYLDRADPVTYATNIRDNVVSQKSIFQSEGFVDNFTPIPSIEALSVSLGLDVVAPVIDPVDGAELAGLSVLDAPVVDNQGGTTRVLLQYEAAINDDGHFVLFDTERGRLQSIQFLKTLAATGAATVVSQ